ncbi:MAG: N-methyl-L-tryptophan oxidase, partial [Verrucomicrobia bacterium]|nr:N-methyl-L-tryptophan oxidase [Verrucomicrobiota bacterium]
VVTHRGTYQAERVVFCGGAWTDRLVQDLGVSLRVTRQTLGWVWPKTPARFELGRFPVWVIDRLDGSCHYGFPMMPDNPGFKIAHHSPGLDADPDSLVRTVLPGDEESFRPVLRTQIPEADGPLLSLRVCMYTNSPDGNFIVDRHPEKSRVILACGFSGHGFKFATVLGQVLADLATKEKTAHPIEFLGLGRFADGKRK